MPIMTQNSLAAETPPLIKVNLFEHQKRVLYAARELEKSSGIVLNDSQKLVSNVGFISCSVGEFLILFFFFKFFF